MEIDRKLFEEYEKLFLEENHKVNLISENDEKYLWEKHIYDSLALSKFFEKYSIPSEMLDIGTGGGFPAVPVAIAYPQITIMAFDSIAKKIQAVQAIKNGLKLNNLLPVCLRIENYSKKFEFITARAVSSLKNVCQYALPKLKKGGYFVAFKSKKYVEEIEEAQEVLMKYKAEIVDVIKYDLPLEEDYERYLLVIASKK